MQRGRSDSSTTSKPKQAVLYARVSSKEQEREGFSIPAQQKLLRSYAAENDIKVAREFTDIETAKTSGRTAFGEMLKFLAGTPSCRTLLVEKTDRLYRNMKDLVSVDELDLEIHFVKENVVLSRDSRSSDKFMHGIRVLMAKNFIDNLSEEVRKGMTEKAETGIWPSYAPFGYRNVDGPDGKRTIEPDPGVAPVIRRLFERYSSGRISIKDATQIAAEDGLRPRSGKGRIPPASIHKILRNRIYCGEFDWKGKTYRGKYPPLISKDLWSQVQQALTGRLEKRHRHVKHDFAFSGLISCGHCGCSLVGEIKKGKYVYYHCTGYKGKCPEAYTREEVFEQRFSDLLKGLRMDAKVAEWVTGALRRSHAEEKQDDEEAITRLRTQETTLENRLRVLYDDRLDGRIDTETHDRKAAQIRAELAEAHRLIEVRHAADRSYVDAGVRLLELTEKAHQLFIKRSPREKRELLDFFVSNSSWKNGELTVTFRKPFDLLMDTNISYGRDVAVMGSEKARNRNWPARPDSNRGPSA
jgi:site-specific DNA recombinase